MDRPARYGLDRANLTHEDWAVHAVDQLPADAVLLVGNTPSVGWWTDRATVLCPTSSRMDLDKVIATYHATHLLVADQISQQVQTELFRPEDLQQVEQARDWSLHQISGMPTTGSEEQETSR